MLGERSLARGGHGEKTGGSDFVPNMDRPRGQRIVFEMAEIGTAIEEEKFLLCSGDIC